MFSFRSSHPYLSAGLIVLACATGCRKAETTAVADYSDSLVQNTYVISRTASTNPTGCLVMAPFNVSPSRLMIMDGAAHLQRELQRSEGVLNFRRWDNAQGIRYTWFEADPALPAGSQLGSVVIADDSLKEIKRVNLLPYGSIPDTGRRELDGHDFILIDDDHYIAMAYVPMHVHNLPASLGTSGDAFVLNPVIQEVRGGRVVWQWEGIDHPEFYTGSTVSNNFSDAANAQDYMHLNSMFLDASDGNLICSFRHTDQVIKISRQTGDVVWRLGGKSSDFPLTEEMKMLRQHDATLTDGGRTLMIFDNGDLDLRPYSRVLEFQLDEAGHRVSHFQAYTIPEPLSRIMGSVQKFGDRYFICGGSGNYLLEVNYRTGEKILELKSAVSTYRAYKYEW